MPTINPWVARGPNVAGNQRIVNGAYTGPASYVSGGDALVPGDIGLGDIEFITFNSSPAGQLVTYNYATGKVQWYAAGTGAEIAGGVALNAQTVRYEAKGK
jgi:hypothetical protein